MPLNRLAGLSLSDEAIPDLGSTLSSTVNSGDCARLGVTSDAAASSDASTGGAAPRKIERGESCEQRS